MKIEAQGNNRYILSTRVDDVDVVFYVRARRPRKRSHPEIHISRNIYSSALNAQARETMLRYLEDQVMQNTMQVAMNDHARRQTAESNFSHYEPGFAALCALVEHHLDAAVVLNPGDEDGEVIKVTLPGDGFYSAVTQATPDMEFISRFKRRNEDEYPYISSRAVAGTKVPAEEADIILYSKQKLAVKGENSTDFAWEIVSINGKRKKGAEPPHPVTMLRNQRDYPGGTKMKYTSEQWAESVEHWFGGGPEAPFIMLDC